MAKITPPTLPTLKRRMPKGLKRKQGDPEYGYRVSTTMYDRVTLERFTVRELTADKITYAASSGEYTQDRIGLSYRWFSTYDTAAAYADEKIVERQGYWKEVIAKLEQQRKDVKQGKFIEW